jgi:hypothetical protein
MQLKGCVPAAVERQLLADIVEKVGFLQRRIFWRAVEADTEN